MNTNPARSELTIEVDGHEVHCLDGQSVASALLMAGIYRFRSSPNDKEPRGPFCMMGSCQECAILIDGSIRQACQTRVRPGLRASLRGAQSW